MSLCLNCANLLVPYWTTYSSSVQRNILSKSAEIISSTTDKLNDATDGPNNPPETDDEDTEVVHEYIIKEHIIDNGEVVDDGR